jgi:molecular chaperone GrpE (heat shock protein)
MLMTRSDGIVQPTFLSELEKYVAEQLVLVHGLKREVADKEKERQDQLRDFLLGQIELLDAMEQKEATLRERHADVLDALKIITSYGSVHKRLLRQLERYGVKPIVFPNDRLLVGLSKVVGNEPDSSRPNDGIISIEKQGYMRGSIVLREAELIIVKN